MIPEGIGRLRKLSIECNKYMAARALCGEVEEGVHACDWDPGILRDRTAVKEEKEGTDVVPIANIACRLLSYIANATSRSTVDVTVRMHTRPDPGFGGTSGY
jgi:hypothetical protein